MKNIVSTDDSVKRQVTDSITENLTDSVLKSRECGIRVDLANKHLTLESFILLFFSWFLTNRVKDINVFLNEGVDDSLEDEKSRFWRLEYKHGVKIFQRTLIYEKWHSTDLNRKKYVLCHKDYLKKFISLDILALIEKEW